ncbi:MAG: type II 3-dehydroquinate dehydratase [Campylobacteraceae bacterium]|jgi:3-dehydroquinate dehydratase-2|nr:type II 3-dehydroquinate dehydratase [Campylobacteraceae bacterium]
MKIVVIQGPNLNMLGHREQSIYGAMKLEDIHAQMQNVAKQNNFDIEFFQSNFEGEIIDKLQECLGDANGVIINPAAYSHTSVAIRDAISAINIPVVEVHISNIYRREEFRQKSLTAPVCAGQIAGFGPFGYHLALMAIMQMLAEIEAIKKKSEAAVKQ